MSIELVQGDDKPDIKITIRDSNTGEPGDPESWDVVDLSPANVTVSMKFRRQNTTTILETFTLSKVDGGTGGEVLLLWNPTSLDVDPGNYEGELEINENGSIQTLTDILKFKIKPQF
jgi:hypothetical protein